MPIRKYVSSATFGRETIKDMTTAFERIRTILKLEDPDDPLVEVVAKFVILTKASISGRWLTVDGSPWILPRLTLG